MGYSRARAVVTAHSCARRHGTPCVQYTQTHLGSLKRSRAHTRSRRAWRRDLRAARRTRVSICVERSLRCVRSHRPKHKCRPTYAWHGVMAAIALAIPQLDALLRQGRGDLKSQRFEGAYSGASVCNPVSSNTPFRWRTHSMPAAR